MAHSRIQNFGPQVVSNPFVLGPRAGSGTSGFAGRLGPLNSSQPQEDVNVQLARSLLLDPGITETHRTRLRGLIAAHSPADRQRTEALEDQERRALRSFLDENKVTEQEERDLAEEFQRRHPNSLAPAPRQFRRALEGEQQPLLELANVSEMIAKDTANDSDLVQSLIPMDPKTGGVDKVQALRVLSELRRPETEGRDRLVAQQKFIMQVRVQQFEQQVNMIMGAAEATFDQGGVFSDPDVAGNMQKLAEAQSMVTELQKISFPEMFPQQTNAGTPQLPSAMVGQQPAPESLDTVTLENQAKALGLPFVRSNEHAEQMLKSGQLRSGDEVILWTGERKRVK